MGLIMCLMAWSGNASKIWAILGGACLFLGAVTALIARKI
jgi:hypothetical protein